MNASFPLTVPAIRVEQPLGIFFAVALTARTLLEVAFSDVVSATREENGTYSVTGAQRLSDPRRLDAIARYVNRIDATFPNSIILAANMHGGGFEGDVDVDDDARFDEAQEVALIQRRWSVATTECRNADGELTATNYLLTIPTREKLAAVIDGQHRLFAFARATPDRLDDQLLCSVFLDLPNSIQAQIFATINSNQKAVDKSLTYELFGYNLSDEPEDQWSPEKLAVFLARRLATDPASPMAGRVAVAPVNDFATSAMIKRSDIKLSFAVIVGGILRLISSNPKEDANKLKRTPSQTRATLPTGKPPFRDLYRVGDDAMIYGATRNFLAACERLFWSEAPPSSFILKTVGVQALFDVYRELAGPMLADGDLTEEAFVRALEPAAGVDFDHERFRASSGSNRTAIRRILRARMHLIEASELPPGDERFLG